MIMVNKQKKTQRKQKILVTYENLNILKFPLTEHQEDSISIKQEQARMKNKKKEIKIQVINSYNTLNKM